jgi:hypothetical protein
MSSGLLYGRNWYRGLSSASIHFEASFRWLHRPSRREYVDQARAATIRRRKVMEFLRPVAQSQQPIVWQVPRNFDAP